MYTDLSEDMDYVIDIATLVIAAAVDHTGGEIAFDIDIGYQ